MSHVTGRAAKRREIQANNHKQPNKQQQTEKEVGIRSWGVLTMKIKKLKLKSKKIM